MSIADKLLQVNQVKQDIKQAIEDKGVAMSGVPFTNYPLKINEISGEGGGEGSPLEFTDDLEKAISVKEVFAMSDKVNNLNKVWEDYKRTPELKYDLALTRVAENQDLAGIAADIYIGSSDLITLYNDCVNGTVNDDDLYITSTLFVAMSEYLDTAFQYYGDISSFFGVPFPVYSFGLSLSAQMSYGTAMMVFLLADLTPLEMGLGISLMKPHMGFNNTESIKLYSKYSNYKQGLIADLSKVGEYPAIQYNMPLYIDDTIDSIEDSAFVGWAYNNYPLVIPNSVVRIGFQGEYNQPDYAGAFSYWELNNKQIVFGSNLKHIGLSTFEQWLANNQPLVLPEGLETIGYSAFRRWISNNHPLTIPNSVTSIGEQAFSAWTVNDQPLVIGNSVTSISNDAFSAWEANNQPLVIGNSVTSIGDYAFNYWTSNNQPLIIPDSVTSIGKRAFYNWTANDQPLVIPDSVTSIGDSAFNGWTSVPYVEMKSETPPTLESSYAFFAQNNAPIYVPDGSVDDYKTATNWVDLASRIFAISEK